MADCQSELWCRSSMCLWNINWEVSSVFMDLQVEVSRSCIPHEEDFFRVLIAKFSSSHKFLTELHRNHSTYQIPGNALLLGTCRVPQLSDWTHRLSSLRATTQVSQLPGLPAACTAFHMMTNLSCRLGSPSDFQHAFCTMATVFLCQAEEPLAWLNSGLDVHELWQTPPRSWRMEYQKVHYYLWMQNLSLVSVFRPSSYTQTSLGFSSWVLLLPA